MWFKRRQGAASTGAARQRSQPPSRPQRAPLRAARADWLDQEFCVLDVETTGLYPGGHDRVVEIAMLRMEGTSVVSEWSTLVDPRRDIGPTRIHGIAAGDVIGAPQFHQVLGDILEHLHGAVLVAHNLPFDRRFLQAEFARAEAELPDLPGLCTRSLGSRLQPGQQRRTLTACCERLGIDLPYAHEALSDARATAELLATYLDMADRRGWRTLGDVGCSPLQWPRELPAASPSGRQQQRGASEARLEAQGRYLATLVHRLPDTEELDSDTNSYLELLDRALEDRRLTDDEAEALAKTASEWGLDRDQARLVHDRYFGDLLNAAMADEIITHAERADLRLVGTLLGIDSCSVESRIRSAERKGGPKPTGSAATSSSLVGLSVCFTGQLTACTRETAERLAEEAGLVVQQNVTKKLDLLVVADPETQSGKAKKARAYGTRVMAEAAFWAALGISVR